MYSIIIVKNLIYSFAVIINCNCFLKSNKNYPEQKNNWISQWECTVQYSQVKVFWTFQKVIPRNNSICPLRSILGPMWIERGQIITFLLTNLLTSDTWTFHPSNHVCHVWHFFGDSNLWLHNLVSNREGPRARRPQEPGLPAPLDISTSRPHLDLYHLLTS